jgi:hypothetical protein
MDTASDHAGMKRLAKTKTEKKFAVVLLDAIDVAFTALGQNVKTSIYFHLETKFGLPKQDIPDRVDDFTDALDRIFGQASQQLEILIMKNLNEKVNCNYEWVGPKWLVPDLTFEKYLKLVKLCIEGAGKTGDIEVLLDDGARPDQKTR